METEDLITIEQAARELRVSRMSIYAAIDTGKLVAVTVAGRKLIDRKSLSSYVPRPLEGKREQQRPAGVKGPSRWDKTRGESQ